MSQPEIQYPITISYSIAKTGMIAFDALLFHTETHEPTEVLIEGLWEAADPSVGIESGYLNDIKVMSLDEGELDMDDYGGEDVIQNLAVEYWEEEL
tara:strand:- start:631 stop:918 length:288 start_codon:yes stop_codon:yes gene_type:complete